MTPEQALQILDAVRKVASMSYADHANAEKAVQVLAKALQAAVDEQAALEQIKAEQAARADESMDHA